MIPSLATLLLWTPALGIWLVALSLVLWGSRLATKHSKPEPLHPEARNDFRPVSILKPVKGLEGELRKNLESFFSLNYPSYELLFSVADSNDPSIPVIDELIQLYSGRPGVQARLIIGAKNIGENPKVNNLARSYQEARYDWILISDSNVRANPDYLECAALEMKPGVGMVTAIVFGYEPRGLGGWLEAAFLNSFYARWMLVSHRMNIPVVVGKSMLFRRSDANRFGGMNTLSKYLAEDYMAGRAITFLGLKVKVMRTPAAQPLGFHSLSSFWSRHVRWGRIRKAQAPLAFAFEPAISFWISGVIGAAALQSILGLPVIAGLLLHAAIWMVADLRTMLATGDRFSMKLVLAWLLRETLHLPLWIHISLGRSVSWRGNTLIVARGGLLEPRAASGSGL